MGGKILTSQECELLGETDNWYLTHTLSLYPGVYLGWHETTSQDDAELFNHSCSPNVGVVGQIVFVARRDIAVNEELTFDYDTTETSGEPFECECGADNCRKVVGGESWRNQAFLDSNREFLSWYISPNFKLQTSNFKLQTSAWWFDEKSRFKTAELVVGEMHGCRFHYVWRTWGVRTRIDSSQRTRCGMGRHRVFSG